MFGDRLFYPLAGLLIAAIIALALFSGGGEDLSDSDIIRQGWGLKGPELNALTISPGSNAEYQSGEGGFIRLSQFTPDGDGPASIGVFATLGPAHERAFAGQALEISFRARANPNDPLDAFEAAYFPMESAASEWVRFDLTTEWQDYTFEFTPTPTSDPENVDILAIFPGRRGRQKDVDIASIEISVPSATPAAGQR
jgi:hypothetical protein